MSLYLCIFAGDQEVAGIEAGSYADFNALRGYVVTELEQGDAGARFPVFIYHDDSDGEWSVEACAALQSELVAIIAAMKERPAVEFSGGWQKALAESIDLNPRNALESFIDVDGEPLLERLYELVGAARSCGQPILFQ